VKTSEKNSYAQDRRRFCIAAGTAVGGVVVAALLPKTLLAADLPHLAETDPTGSAMGYKEDTTKVDEKKYTTHKPEQTCNKCRYFQGEANAAYGPCQIFVGKAVNAKGWCQVFMAK